MSDKKISELAASTTPLAGTEVLPIVQSGVTKKVSVDNLTAGKTVNAANLVITDDAAIGTTISTGIKLRLRTPQTGTAISADNSVNSGFVVKFAPNLTNIGNDFSQPLGFLVSDVQQAKIESTGNFTLNTGNVVIGTSGKGIDFSADGQAAGMTSELLADYEEGTWTPTLTSTGTAPTIGYSTQIGNYVKVGKLVYWSVEIVTSSATGGTGSLLIGGFPYVAGVSRYTGGGCAGAADNWTTRAPEFAYLYQGNSSAYLTAGGTTSSVHITVSNLTNGAMTLIMSGTYISA